MKLIAVTPELPHEHEIDFIAAILDAGFSYVHIRKPALSAEETRGYIMSIPSRYHKRLKLHDHFHLALEFDLAGIHLNSRNSSIPAELLNRDFAVTKSCHSAAKLTSLEQYEYVFLSPIFDSISKHGYHSQFSYAQLADIFSVTQRHGKVVALGGIMPRHIPQLRKIGFAGAAFLGYLFNSLSIDDLNNKLSLINNSLKCYNS